MTKQSEEVAHGELVSGSETTLHSHAGGGGIPSGIIVMWSGLVANIPSGWYLCDGQNGTPDLRDKFVLSVGDSEEPGGTGGDTTLTHSGTGVQSHAVVSNMRTGGSGVAFASQADASHTVTQPNDHTNVRPPYYKLAFIMKA